MQNLLLSHKVAKRLHELELGRWKLYIWEVPCIGEKNAFCDFLDDFSTNCPVCKVYTGALLDGMPSWIHMQRYMLWAPCTQSAVSMEKVEVIPSFKGNIVVQGCRNLGGRGRLEITIPAFARFFHSQFCYGILKMLGPKLPKNRHAQRKLF